VHLQLAEEELVYSSCAKNDNAGGGAKPTGQKN